MPMTFRVLLLASSAAVAVPSFAQTADQPPSATTVTTDTDAQPATDDESYDEEGETIVVTGQKPRGSVVGDIPPENVLSARDIRATGATSIAELLDAVAAQTGSARGRDGGRPILLLNGQRISGFRELRDLPPEAIERMEVLPEEVALKYGYSADQRVVNIVLRRRFDSTSTELGGKIATDGDYSSGKADATKLIIANGKRTSVNVHLEGNDPLYESDRDIRLDPEAAIDERNARTLTDAGQSARITGTLNRTIGEDIGATVTAEVGKSHSRSRFGLSPFEDDVLTRDGTTTNAGLGAVLNTQRGKWRLSSTANAQIDLSESDSDRSDLAAVLDDKSESKRTSFALDATANGPLFALPAGEATATFKLGASRLDIDSHSRRRDVVGDSDLGRTISEGSANIDLPLTKRASSIGRLGANLNAGLSQYSDFGGLTSIGAGLNWSPTTRINLLSSITREEGAPSLRQLGDPVSEAANVPFFDAVAGENVDVTTITGGNPDLDSDTRMVWKLGGNWRLSEKLDLRLRADFVHQTIDKPQISFPAVTPALEAAFPERFVRDGDGELVSVDLRPVNGDRSRRDTVRWGFDFTKPLKSNPPSAAQIQALRERFGRNAPQTGGGAPTVRTQGQDAGRPSGAGNARFGGGGGGRSGGRNGGRLTFSLTHTLTLKDKLEIGPGIDDLDYLDGEALGPTGGRSRHELRAEAGYYNNGLGARLTADWRSATRVDSAIPGDDLRFSDYADFDLRLFANLGERFELVSKSPFFLGSSLRLDINNIFNARPKVRGGDNGIPLAYQADRLEPVGRTIGITFRKLFLPTRLFRFGNPGGGPRGPGGSGGGPLPPPGG